MYVQRRLLFGGSKDGDDAHVGTFSSVSVKAALGKISQNKSVSSGFECTQSLVPGTYSTLQSSTRFSISIKCHDVAFK